MPHSAAIYVDVGGSPTPLKEDLELMIGWIDCLWALLEERNNVGPGSNRDRAQDMIDRARKDWQQKFSKTR